MTAHNDSNIIAFEKKSGADDALVMVNATNGVVNFNLPAAVQNTSWLDAYTNANVALSTQLSFQPYQYVVLRK
jgi:hypothetical protein